MKSQTHNWEENLILTFKDAVCSTATATTSTVPGPDIHSVHFIVHNSDGGCGPLAGQFLHVGSSHSDGVVVHWRSSTVHWRVPLQ